MPWLHQVALPNYRIFYRFLDFKKIVGVKFCLEEANIWALNLFVGGLYSPSH